MTATISLCLVLPDGTSLPFPINHFLRISISGSSFGELRQLFFSYNVLTSSPFLLSHNICIEHYHTTAFSSKYTLRLSNLITGTDNRDVNKDRNPSWFLPNKNMGVFFQVQVEAKSFRQNGFSHKDAHFHFHGLNAYLLKVWSHMVKAEGSKKCLRLYAAARQ